MSILIKGIDKPKHCYDCPCENEWLEPEITCDAAKRQLDDLGDKIPKWCPMIEVQE